MNKKAMGWASIQAATVKASFSLGEVSSPYW